MLLNCLIFAIICEFAIVHCARTGAFHDIDEDELNQIKPLLHDSLHELKGQPNGAELNLLRIDSARVQVVAGKKYNILAEFENPSDKSSTNCKVMLWHKPWSGYRETQFECDNANKYKVIKQGRAKRDVLVGAPSAVDPKTLQELQEHISESFIQAAGEGKRSLQLKNINGAQKQVVAGILYKVQALVVTPDGEQNCAIDVWLKPWMNFRQVSVDCGDDGDKFKVEHDTRPKRASEMARPLMQSPLDQDDIIDGVSINQNLDAISDVNHFNEFKRTYGRAYANAIDEANRFRIFQNNLYLIRQLNKFEQGSAIYGVTEFADFTQAEYQRRTGLLPRNENDLNNEIGNPFADIPDIDPPKSFDWRDHNAVTPVKNQASCGSCWAFSVTGNIEGLYAIKAGKLQSFSEQELVDCDDLDAGCNGGLPDNAVKFLEKEGGLELESDYPYTAHRSKCHFNSSLSRVQVSGVIDFKHGDEEGMAKWLTANGPISIGINANAMQFYRGGVSHPWKALCRSSSLDHGVLIVGYGVAEYPKFNKTLPYWIVKNSWGPRWGEQGYYRVYRGDNTCGVSSMASSAVLARSNVY